MIDEGYAYEYTYDVPYKYQTLFKASQKSAEAGKKGLWGSVCSSSSVGSKNSPASSATQTSIPKATPIPTSVLSSSPSIPVAAPAPTPECTIKGNISAGVKIYHLQSCGSYSSIVIDESKGERWFCSEQDAIDAGWRKAGNCN